MLFQTKAQKLIHIEKFDYVDKKSKESTSVTKLHFADGTSSRVSAFSFKGDTSSLIIGVHYILDVSSYTLDNGKSGFTLKEITRVND